MIVSGRGATVLWSFLVVRNHCFMVVSGRGATVLW